MLSREAELTLTEAEKTSYDDKVVAQDTLQRASLTTLKVALYHLHNDYAKKPESSREVLSKFLQLCVEHEVDVLYGDANTAGNRYRPSQKYLDPNNSLLSCCIRAMQTEVNRFCRYHERLSVVQIGRAHV